MFNYKVEVGSEVKRLDSCVIHHEIVVYKDNKQVKLPKRKVYCNSIKCRKNSAIPTFFASWFMGMNLFNVKTVKKNNIKIICYCPSCKKYFPIGIDSYEYQTKENVL